MEGQSDRQHSGTNPSWNNEYSGYN